MSALLYKVILPDGTVLLPKQCPDHPCTPVTTKGENSWCSVCRCELLTNATAKWGKK